MIACRRLPEPLSFKFVTVNIAALTLAANPQTNISTKKRDINNFLNCIGLYKTSECIKNENLFWAVESNVVLPIVDDLWVYALFHPIKFPCCEFCLILLHKFIFQ